MDSVSLLQVVGKAVFAASSFKQLCRSMKDLLALVQGEEWDKGSCIEGLLFQVVAMLDHWAKSRQCRKPPRLILPFMELDEMRGMMYTMVAVPGAEASIKKGRVLVHDEFIDALQAQIPSDKPSPAA